MSEPQSTIKEGGVPHDPSTCPRCRWAAERLEYHRWEGIYDKCWIRITDKGVHQRVVSFCPSLDAVAGLIKELGERDLGWLGYYNGSWCWFWPEEWPGPEPEPEWWWKGMHGAEPIETEDYSCVIDAAMATLGKEESDA